MVEQKEFEFIKPEKEEPEREETSMDLEEYKQVQVDKEGRKVSPISEE